MLNKRSITSRSSTVIDDDVDDNIFLRTTKPSTTSYGNTTGYTYDSPAKTTFQQRNDSLEDKKTQLLNCKKDIESRTLESTQRSLSLLRDSEEVGIAAAEVRNFIYCIIL